MIVLTREAIAAIQNSMKVNDRLGYGVRVTAEAGSCSGPKYTMRFEEAPREEDAIIEIRDVRLFVDDATMTMLTGATIDYSNAPENGGFKFDLPVQEESSCGRGSNASDMAQPSLSHRDTISQGIEERGTIQLTDSAFDAVRNAIAGATDCVGGLRIMVESSGCAGNQYKMGLVDEADPDDTVIERDGVKVFVDAKSHELLAGTVVDFVVGLEGEGFTFENPNATSRCSCGKSFS